MTICPFALFDAWLADAAASEPNDPNAMAVASVDDDGQPSVRMVLLKGHDKQGFVFYTNFTSRKGRALLANPRAALLFHWKSKLRQVRIEGPIAPIAEREADAYFASRPRDSQLGAWASDQSQPLASRELFDARFAEVEARFADQPVPRPPHWSGLRVTPHQFEFWQDQPYRLHERRQFCPLPDGGWTEQLLFP